MAKKPSKLLLFAYLAALPFVALSLPVAELSAASPLEIEILERPMLRSQIVALNDSYVIAYAPYPKGPAVQSSMPTDTVIQWLNHSLEPIGHHTIENHHILSLASGPSDSETILFTDMNILNRAARIATISRDSGEAADLQALDHGALIQGHNVEDQVILFGSQLIGPESDAPVAWLALQGKPEQSSSGHTRRVDYAGSDSPYQVRSVAVSPEGRLFALVTRLGFISEDSVTQVIELSSDQENPNKLQVIQSKTLSMHGNKIVQSPKGNLFVVGWDGEQDVIRELSPSLESKSIRSAESLGLSCHAGNSIDLAFNERLLGLACPGHVLILQGNGDAETNWDVSASKPIENNGKPVFIEWANEGSKLIIGISAPTKTQSS